VRLVNDHLQDARSVCRLKSCEGLMLLLHVSMQASRKQQSKSRIMTLDDRACQKVPGKKAGFSSLLFKDHRRPADSLRLERDIHLDAVGDPDKGNPTIHPVVFAVESHRPFDIA
jgi:hypothetical protein